MSHIPTIPRRDTPTPVWTRPRNGRDGPRDGPGGTGGPTRPPRPAREPMFTMPTSVLVMIALMGLVHLFRSQLPFHDDLAILAWFAFIPARYANEWSMLPGGVAADVWTFVTYAMLHGSTMHIVTNAIWLLAFGSAVARRFGWWRFWLFSAAAAAGGAGAHLLLHAGEAIPVVGASAAIAGQMAGAARFVFDPSGPLVFRRGATDAMYRQPAKSMVETLSNRAALAFIVIWFVINLAVGVGSNVTGGLSIAWEAHLGGFIAGFLLFRLFDPVAR